MSGQPSRQPRAVVIEADGGSRGNPGPAAYGALVRDAFTGEVLAEEGTRIGRATNNVAEYSGLVAGLRLAQQVAPEADIEVRMDSKLVVEQMAGRWKIKHPDLRPLAMEAHRLAPFGTTYTWVPRELNRYADRLANEALDGKRDGVSLPATAADRGPAGSGSGPGGKAEPEVDPQRVTGRRSWSYPGGPPTTLLLVRHGVTPHTVEQRFSGGLDRSNPGLSVEGRSQVQATARWLRPLATDAVGVVASPYRRTLETGQILGRVLALPVSEDPGFAEMDFGHWDGLTFAEVSDRHGEDLSEWLGSLDVAPGGGESFRVVESRVLASLDRLVTEHAGRSVLVASHVTPIKTLVAHAVGAPLDAVYRMELTPASLTVLSYYPGDEEHPARSSLRLFNATPGGPPLDHL